MATGSRDGGALRDRFDELTERLRELDLRGRIAASPWPVVGAAALLGAWFAFAPKREPRIRSETRTRLADVAIAALSAIALRMARDAALRQAGAIARRWWETTSPPSDVEAAAEPYHH